MIMFKQTLTFVSVIALISIASVCWAEPPTQEQIEKPAKQANSTINDFFKDTLQERLTWHYTSAAPRSLYEKAKLTYKMLDEIHTQQRSLVKQIEDYEGDDWDKLYGETNLWQQASFYAQLTQLHLQTVDHWQTIAGDNKDPEDKYNTRAQELYECETQEHPDSDKIKEAWSNFKEDDLRNDFELNARFALVLLKTGDDSILKEVTEKWPLYKTMLGNIILTDIYNNSKQPLKNRTMTEIELAAGNVTPNNYETYKSLLNKIAEIEKFQTPDILINIANAQQEIAPHKAINNYLLASEKVADARNSADIVERAALISCRLNRQDNTYQSLSTSVLEKYFSIENRKIDNRILKYYIRLLIDLDNLTDAVTLLAKHINTADCDLENFSISILPKIIDTIEYNNNSDNYLVNCQNIAEYCYHCSNEKNKSHAGILLAELLTYSSDTDSLERAAELLSEPQQNELDTLSIEARLYTARHNYTDALKAWNEIAQLHRQCMTESPLEIIRWLRAKYYSILCYSKLNPDSPEKSVHAIDVLVNSEDIAAEITSDTIDKYGLNPLEFWKNKLENLKTDLLEQKLDLDR